MPQILKVQKKYKKTVSGTKQLHVKNVANRLLSL